MNGRRWRASDPNILENLVAELVSELMAERRAIRPDEAVASFTGGPVRLRRGPQFPDAPPSPT